MEKDLFKAAVDIVKLHDNTLRHALTHHATMISSIVRSLEEGLHGLDIEIVVRNKGKECGYEAELYVFRGEGKNLDLLCWHTISPWSSLSETQHTEVILNRLITKFSQKMVSYTENRQLNEQS